MNIGSSLLDIGYSIALSKLKPACPKSPASRRRETIWKSGKQEGNGPCLISFPDVPDFLIHFS